MVWCGFKNIYQQDMCLNEIGLSTHNMITITGLMINIIGGREGVAIRPIMNHKNIKLDNE